MRSPHRLLGLVAVAVLSVLLLGVVSPAANSEPSGAGIEERVHQAFARSDVPGMVAVVVHRDRIVWSGGVGRASDGAPMTADSVVQVASLTKSLTATAVVQLAQQGRIRLDGSVAAQLGELTMDDPRVQQITVRQLLTHTSGLTDAGTHYYRAIDKGVATPQQVVAALDPEHLSTDPGTRQRYANVNYALAGRLVEVVTGRAIHDQLREQVFIPLRLQHSTLDWDAAPVGHNSVFGFWVSRRDTSSALRNDPAGALATSANDLGRWLIASNGDGPTPLPASVRQQLEQTTANSGGFGLGWARDDLLDGWWNHGGNRYTYSAAMLRNPSTGWGVAVVVNGASMSDPAYAVAQDLASFVRGGDAGSVPSAVGFDRWMLIVVPVALGLGTSGVIRSGGWARRRSSHPALAVVGLLWLLPPVVLAGLLPAAAGRAVGGIDMSWSMLTYYSLTPLVTVLVIAFSCAVVLVARLVAWGRRR